MPHAADVERMAAERRHRVDDHRARRARARSRRAPRPDSARRWTFRRAPSPRYRRASAASAARSASGSHARPHSTSSASPRRRSARTSARADRRSSRSRRPARACLRARGWRRPFPCPPCRCPETANANEPSGARNTRPSRARISSSSASMSGSRWLTRRRRHRAHHARRRQARAGAEQDARRCRAAALMR